MKEIIMRLTCDRCGEMSERKDRANAEYDDEWVVIEARTLNPRLLGPRYNLCSGCATLLSQWLKPTTHTTHKQGPFR
jgi:hypothetical protein